MLTQSWDHYVGHSQTIGSHQLAHRHLVTEIQIVTRDCG